MNYTDGELTSAALRGDRYRGRDVTECIRLSGIVPVRLSESLTIEVRGEINCAEGVFNAYNTLIQSSGDKGYTTARNAVAGWLLSGNVGLIGTLTQLTVYDVIGLVDTHTENTSKLNALGFTTARHLGAFSFNDDRGVLEIFRDSAKLRLGSETDCLWDGLVYKLNSHADRAMVLSRLSQSEIDAQTTPRWSIAHKYPPDGTTSIVEGIQWTVGIDGRISPVAVITPVVCGGVTISNVTLHSAARLIELDCSIGDIVAITRNGDVIPHIQSVVYRHDSHIPAQDTLPVKCVSCGSELSMVGKHLFCMNGDICPAQELAKLVRFVSRNGFRIDDCGPERLKLMVEHGVLLGSDVSGFYSDGFESRCAMAIGSTVVAAKIAQSLEAAKTRISFANYLYALNIPKLGYTMARQLARHYDNIQDMLQSTNQQLSTLTRATVDQWVNLRTSLLSDRITELDHWLRSHGVKPFKLSGSVVSFAVTGTLSQSRELWDQQLQEYSCTFAKSVNKAVKALVVGEHPSQSKITAANKLQIPIWTETQLTEYIQTLQ